MIHFNLRKRLAFCLAILQFAKQRPRERMQKKLTKNDRKEPRIRHWKNAESRFDGTRTLPYAYWGGECQSERAHALGENAFGSRFMDCGRETGMHRWTDSIFPSLSRWSPLRGKSCHLAREDWFFYSTRQFFKEIAILWKNSSIVNDDESITSRVNVRVQRKSEKLYEVNEKRKGLVKNNVMVIVNAIARFGPQVMCGKRSVISRIELSRKSVFIYFNDMKAMQLNICHLIVAWVWMKSLQV